MARDQAKGFWQKTREELSPKLPPVFTPFSTVGIGDRPYGRIHRWHSRLMWRRHASLRRRLYLFVRLLAWVLRLPRLSRKATALYGHRAAGESGKSRARQVLEQVYLGLRYSIPPVSYYLFRLFEPDRRRNASQYIHRFETKGGLFAFLNRNLGDDSARKLLGNKSAFAMRCRERGLPTPPLYLELQRGEIIQREWKSDSLPPVDLIVKRRVGKGGHVMMRWEYLGDDEYRGSDGEVLGSAALMGRLKEDSAEIPFIVVKRMRNHPDILDFAGPGGNILTSCRLVTAFNENDEPEVVSSTYKIAVDQTVADNVHFGGLASPVDIRTGMFGPGISTSPLGVPVDVHPLSGARITGTKLPLWEETLSLVKRAHRQFPEAIFIGWDVGITADGPVLIEGNSATCVHLQQTPHGEPLGAGRFGEIMAYHLDRLDPATALYWSRSRKEDLPPRGSRE
jgi:hypothetical protein